MNIRLIHTDEDYHAALKSVSVLFDNEPEPKPDQVSVDS